MRKNSGLSQGLSIALRFGIEMAVATAFGRVTADDIPGEVAVMVRFQGAVSVFRAVIPQGLPVDDIAGLTDPIDVHVFAKLKELGIPPSPVSAQKPRR